MNFQSKRDWLFIILSGFFVTNAVIAEVIGGKLVQIGPFTMSIGVVPWPVVFLTTDLINEYYGKAGVRFLSLLTAGLIAYVFVVLYVAVGVSAVSFSPVSDVQFSAVFGQSLWIIVGSITAFLTAQLIDVLVFCAVKNRTGGRHLWLRATGSTVVSQLIDTFIVLGIAFWLPGRITAMEFVRLALTGYIVKLLIAIGITPLIYMAHALIDNYLGERKKH